MERLGAFIKKHRLWLGGLCCALAAAFALCWAGYTLHQAGKNQSEYRIVHDEYAEKQGLYPTDPAAGLVQGLPAGEGETLYGVRLMFVIGGRVAQGAFRVALESADGQTLAACDGDMTMLLDGAFVDVIFASPVTLEKGSGYQLHVTFAPALAVNSETSIADDLSGLHNVTMTRSFPAGWSTICLPFETTVAALGATQAQAFTAFADNVLTFEKVADGNLAANTPYLIYFEEAKDLSAAPIYMPVEIESSTPGVVNHGDVTFTGNYTAGKDMEGLYGVADQNGSQYIMMGDANSTLGSTSAYFTVAVAQTNAMRIQLEGGATAIDKVTTDGETFDVYTLGGVKVRENATGLNGLQKGIYIVNGKKVVVK